MSMATEMVEQGFRFERARDVRLEIRSEKTREKKTHTHTRTSDFPIGIGGFAPRAQPMHTRETERPQESDGRHYKYNTRSHRRWRRNGRNVRAIRTITHGRRWTGIKKCRRGSLADGRCARRPDNRRDHGGTGAAARKKRGGGGGRPAGRRAGGNGSRSSC